MEADRCLVIVLRRFRVTAAGRPGMPPRVAGWIVQINSETEQLDFRVTMIINTARGREVNNILCELELEYPWTLPAPGRARGAVTVTRSPIRVSGLGLRVRCRK